MMSTDDLTPTWAKVLFDGLDKLNARFDELNAGQSSISARLDLLDLRTQAQSANALAELAKLGLELQTYQVQMHDYLNERAGSIDSQLAALFGVVADIRREYPPQDAA